jgi:uncharacterized membrane protein
MIRFLLILGSILGSGLMAGTFFAFSAFIMRALSRLPTAQGIAAMQSINVVVLNPCFLGIFLGTGALCIGVGISSLTAWSRPGAAWLLVGSVLYVVGNVVVTRVCNVPRNEALALIDPMSPSAANTWTNYLVTWNAWNHVRTITGLIAMASLTIGLWLSRASETTQ